MPIVSGGGGGTFNGGTITGQLVVAPTNPALTSLLKVVAPAGFGDAVFEIDSGAVQLVYVDPIGDFGITAPAGQGYASFHAYSTDSGTAAGNYSANAILISEAGTIFSVTAARTYVGSSAFATAPAASSAATLALGSAYQNTLGYDVLLCVYLSVTVNTSGVLKLGVGPTATPTQQTLVTGITSTGLWPVPIYLPDQYYALLSVTGTITVAVDGQIAMPV